MNVLQCGLWWVSEIYHLKKVLQNCLKNVLKFYSTLNALIFAIPLLMIIITFHNTFRIILSMNNIKK